MLMRGNKKNNKVSSLPPALLTRVSDYVKNRLGASYPKIKAENFGLIIAETAASRGFADPVEYAEWLLSDNSQSIELSHLATHLTVGETYFFRHMQIFDSFRDEILPSILDLHTEKDKNIRIWSAGCSSGEEAYSIAMILDMNKDRFPPFDLAIYASDINTTLMDKAKQGQYTPWSFRETPDQWIEKFFVSEDNKHYFIRDDIKRHVIFSTINLLDDSFPSYKHPVGEMDIIFCRNVLIYFDDVQIRKITEKIYHCLRPGGWLITAPAEAPAVPDDLFKAVKIGENFYFKRLEPGEKENYEEDVKKAPAVKPVIPKTTRSGSERVFVKRRVVQKTLPKKQENKPKSDIPEKRPAFLSDTHDDAIRKFRAGSYREAEEMVNRLGFGSATLTQALELASAFADAGNFAQAHNWLDEILGQDNLCVQAYYQRGLVYMAESNDDQARKAFQQSLFLKPEFPAAYFSLGTMLIKKGKNKEAEKLFKTALKYLGQIPDEETIEGPEDMTAGELKAVITSLLKQISR